jgi:hypothetical protein
MIETEQIVAVAWHRSRTSLCYGIVALLRRGATLLLRNVAQPQNSALFCRSKGATEGGVSPSYRSSVATSYS